MQRYITSPHIIIKHLIAKEMYKVSLNMLGTKMKKQKEQMSQEALTIFR